MKSRHTAFIYILAIASFSLSFVAFRSDAGWLDNLADWCDNNKFINSCANNPLSDAIGGTIAPYLNNGTTNTSTGANSGTTNPGTGSGNTNTNTGGGAQHNNSSGQNSDGSDQPNCSNGGNAVDADHC